LRCKGERVYRSSKHCKLISEQYKYNLPEIRRALYLTLYCTLQCWTDFFPHNSSTEEARDDVQLKEPKQNKNQNEFW
jgi:hypothetical protein